MKKQSHEIERGVTFDEFKVIYSYLDKRGIRYIHNSKQVQRRWDLICSLENSSLFKKIFYNKWKQFLLIHQEIYQMHRKDFLKPEEKEKSLQLQQNYKSHFLFEDLSNEKEFADYQEKQKEQEIQRKLDQKLESDKIKSNSMKMNKNTSHRSYIVREFEESSYELEIVQKGQQNEQIQSSDGEIGYPFKGLMQKPVKKRKQ